MKNGIEHFGADSPEVADEVLATYRAAEESPHPSGFSFGALLGELVLLLLYGFAFAAVGFGFYGLYRLFALLFGLF
jgi:hypothetical protein